MALSWVYTSERSTKMHYRALLSGNNGHWPLVGGQGCKNKTRWSMSFLCVKSFCCNICCMECSFHVNSVQFVHCKVKLCTVLWWPVVAAVKMCRVISDKSDFCAAKWNLMAACLGKVKRERDISNEGKHKLMLKIHHWPSTHFTHWALWIYGA